MKLLLLLFTAFSAFACGTDDGVLYNAGNAVKITGMVHIYGNEPHTFAGIVDANGTQYAVYPRSSEDELRSLQGHLIEFTVVFVDERVEGSMYLKGGTVRPISWVIIR